jgi:hypothetical protein
VARASVRGESAGVRGASGGAGGAVAVQRNTTRRVASAAEAVAAGGGGAVVDGRAGLRGVSSHVRLSEGIEQLLTSVSWYGFTLVTKDVSLPLLPSSSSLLLSVSFCWRCEQVQQSYGGKLSVDD